MPDETPDSERPWTEAQWEEFMKKSDLRAAMYQERLETEFNARQRGEEIDENAISEDMGWQEDYEPSDDDGVDRPWLEDAFEKLSDPEFKDEIEREEREEQEALEKILPYRRSIRLSRQIRHWLGPVLDRPFDESSDACRLLGTLCVGPDTCGAKIAGGHGMGYDDLMIGGNIVNNRRGRDALVEARDALAELVEMQEIAADTAKKIAEQLEELIAQMDERIAELRKRITW
jgi:hypothetical protein